MKARSSTRSCQHQHIGDKALAKKMGLKFCGGCYSGLDLDIKQKFENVLQG